LSSCQEISGVFSDWDSIKTGTTPTEHRKRGKIVAKLLPENDPDDKPWLLLRGMGTLRKPFQPVISETDIEARR